MTQIYDTTAEYAQTAGESMDLALQDLERIVTLLGGPAMRSALTAEERLKIIKKAKELRNFAGFINDSLETIERTALN